MAKLGFFEPYEKLSEICGLLDELKVEYTVHYHDDGEYAYLNDGEACVTVLNPYIDDSERTVYIDLGEEITFSFNANWHVHYSPDEDGYTEFIKTLRGLLTNELCTAVSYLGSERKWSCSTICRKSDVRDKPPEELFAGSCIMAPVVKEKWEMNGADVCFLFWNSKDDVTILI